MGQHRELVPVTVYLPPVARNEADDRARSEMISTAALLRQILLGKALPLDGAGG